MDAAKVTNDCDECMKFLVTNYGGRHYEQDKINKLVKFRTHYKETPNNIVNPYRKYRLDAEVEVDYALKCGVKEWKIVLPTEAQLYKILRNSLHVIVNTIIMGKRI